MRFRSKIGLAVWIYAIISPMWVLNAIRFSRASGQPLPSIYLVTAITYFVLFVFLFSMHRFTYWDIHDTGVTERRLWKTKSIPWTEIARVMPWQPGKRLIPDTIEITYHRDPPMSDDGSIIASPSNIPQFLEALQTRAPQVIVDL